MTTAIHNHPAQAHYAILRRLEAAHQNNAIAIDTIAITPPCTSLITIP